jgi:hypothetical protein
VRAGERLPVSPSASWVGIGLSPAAWFADLVVSDALLADSCRRGDMGVLHAITAGALVLTLVGLAVSATCRARAKDDPSPGARVERFLGMAGMALSVLSALAIVAIEVPKWMLRPCA